MLDGRAVTFVVVHLEIHSGPPQRAGQATRRMDQIDR
jgi:hypothetical protein